MFCYSSSSSSVSLSEYLPRSLPTPTPSHLRTACPLPSRNHNSTKNASGVRECQWEQNRQRIPLSQLAKAPVHEKGSGGPLRRFHSTRIDNVTPPFSPPHPSPQKMYYHPKTRATFSSLRPTHTNLRRAPASHSCTHQGPCPSSPSLVGSRPPRPPNLRSAVYASLTRRRGRGRGSIAPPA